MTIITRLKNALEFVRFADPNIREAYVDAINELAADMKEVEFEEAVATRAAFDKLDAAITDYENREQAPLPIADEIDEVPESVVLADAETEVDAIIETESDDDDIEL